MKSILLLAAVFTLFSVCVTSVTAAEGKAKKKRATRLRHVVCFKYKEGTSNAKIAEIGKAFRGLKSKIPGITGFETGVNNSPEVLNKGVTHVYLVTFDSEKSRDAYLPHPEHKAFVALLKPHLEDVFVVDYFAK